MPDERILEKILIDAIAMQEAKLLRVARQLVPTVTADDLLQPFDMLVLDQNPVFRHEEGILEGLHMALSAIRASLKESS
jgi:hypothetical protein